MHRSRRRISDVLLATLFLGLVLTASRVSAREVTIAVFDAAAPVVFADAQGRAAGVFPELLSRIVSESGHEPRFVTGLSLAEALEAVADGSIDLLPAAVRTDEREERFDFNDEPVLVAWGQLGVRPGKDFDSLLDIRGAAIGLMREGQNGTNFIRTMASFDIPFDPRYYATFDEVTDAVLSGEVAAGVDFNSWFHGESRIVASSVVFSPTQAFIATARGTNGDLLTAIDARLAEIKSDPGSYYFDVIDRWMAAGRTAAIPQWVGIASAAAALTVAALFALNRLLARRVQRATASLEESRERYRTVADHAHGWEFWIGPDGDSLYVSPNTEAVTGYPARDFVRDPGLARRIVHEDDRGLWDDHICDRGSSEEQIALTYRIRRADGEIRWIEHWCTRIETPDGAYRGIRGTNIDITERRADHVALETALEEKNAMLREIHHRVKNNLQTISSLVAIQRATARDPDTDRHLDAIAGRVYAMGALHEAIYRNDRFGRVAMDDYIPTILLHVQRSVHLDSAVRIEHSVEPVELSLDQALPCGLIVNEAVTNALKHAFPEGRGGTVRVGLAVGDDSQVTLSVCDDGIGYRADSAERSERGIGVSLVEILARQLAGQATFETSGGTAVRVRFGLPAPSVEAL